MWSKFDKFNRALGLVGGSLVLISSILMTYEVIMRYFFHNAPNWTSDTARYLLLAIAFLPVAYALQHKAHINVDIVVVHAKKAFKTLLDYVYYLAVIIFSVIVGWNTLGYFKEAVATGRLTHGNLEIPISWLYAVILFGLAMLILVSLIRIAENALKKTFLPMDKNTLE